MGDCGPADKVDTFSSRADDLHIGGILSGVYVRPEKFQFLEKRQNHNFGYKIVISVKNPKFILWISDDETYFTVGIVSRNLASTSNFVGFRDSRSWHIFRGIAIRVS